jgi:Ca2+-binding RTX toxin-like protein
MDPTFIPTVSSTVTDPDTPNLSIPSGGFAYIGANIRVAATQSEAIFVQSLTTVQIDGQAIGELGYFADGDDNTLSIGAHGLAWGSVLGIEMIGGENFVDNAGTIFGNDIGVVIQDPFQNEIQNSGSILAGARTVEINSAILISGDDVTLGSQLINNSGVIATRLADGFSIFSTGNVADTVLNSGRIAGDLSLGNGSDLLDTSHGTLTGSIDMGAGNDTVRGSAAADIVFGEAGNDQLFGNAGNDRLEGDRGVDLLTGGAGADRFVFRLGDSGNTVSTEDRITDFSHAQHDGIDLRGFAVATLHANAAPTAFHFIGTKAFTHHAGELHYSVSGGNAFVSGDFDGNGAADFTIRLDHVSSLVAADFIL